MFYKMATIAPKILKENKKTDGTWNVLYRLSHNRKTRYIKTTHFVDETQIVGKDDISVDFVIDFLAADIKKYRKKISEIENIDLYTVDEVKEMIFSDSKEIDLFPFFGKHIELLKSSGRGSTATPYTTVYNSLKDYVNNGHLYASKVTSKFLQEYEIYLRTPKNIERENRGGSKMKIKDTFLTDKGVHNHMANFRTLFNKARDNYNDEDLGKILIKNYPFSKYKIKPKKNLKHKNIDIEDIRSIRDVAAVTRREVMAKNIFMLSFYMCGMNAVDIYNNIDRLKELPERIGYKRSKTRGKRPDEAFISVKIPKEAKKIIEVLEINYSTSRSLNGNLSNGLRSLNDRLKIDGLTMYSARHSFATIARNDLNISRDDVSLALNHVNQDSRITDTYLAPDWSKIDRVQDAVIMKINEDLES